MHAKFLLLTAGILCMPGCMGTPQTNRELANQQVSTWNGATLLACPPEAGSCKGPECVRFIEGFEPPQSYPDSCFVNVRTEAGRFDLDTLGRWSELLDDMASPAGVFAYSDIRARGCSWFESVAPKLDASTWRVALPFLGLPCTKVAVEVILAHPSEFSTHIERALRFPDPYVSAAETVGVLGRRLDWLVPMLVARSSDQEDWLVARHAVQALGYVGDEGVAPTLEEALQSPDFGRALAALEARVRVAESEQALRGFLKDTAIQHYSCEVRAEAQQALRYLDQGQLIVPARGQSESHSGTEYDGGGPLVRGVPPRKPFASDFPSSGRATVPTRSRPTQGSCESSQRMLPVQCFQETSKLDGLPELSIVLPGETGRVLQRIEVPRDVRASIEWDHSTKLLASSGGLVALGDDGSASLIARGSFLSIVRFDGSVYVVSQQNFESRLALVLKRGDGWSIRPVLELPGAPLGVARIGSDLVVAAAGGDAYLGRGSRWRMVCGNQPPVAAEP